MWLQSWGVWVGLDFPLLGQKDDTCDYHADFEATMAAYSNMNGRAVSCSWRRLARWVF